MANSPEALEQLRAQVQALTARVYSLEQRVSPDPAPPTTAAPPGARAEAPPTTSVAPPPPPRTQSQTPLRGASTLPGGTVPAAPILAKPRTGNLEEKIGKYWLNRIGVFAILIGVAYFLKFAFDNDWIGPAGRVAIGLIAGIAVIVGSESVRKKNYLPFSYSLKAVGIGVLYLSLWGAFQVYHLIGSGVAFGAMIVVTAATMVMALAQDAEILAAYAVIGGLATPMLLSTGQNHEVALFSYVALLDAAVLVMAAYKPWRRLFWLSFIGTQVLYNGWADEYYSQSQRPITVFFAIAFGVIFALIPVVTPHDRSRVVKGTSTTLTLLPFLNAGALFFALFRMYESQSATLAWYAVGLAAMYLLLSNLFKYRDSADSAVTTVISLLHVAIAIAFLTIAIPLKLDSHWITIGWLIESAVLLWIAVRTQVDLVRIMAGCTLALAIFRLIFIDNYTVDRLILNARFLTYIVAVAILGGIVWAGERYAYAAEKPLLRIAAIGLNVLALIALTLEAADYFTAQRMQVLYQHDIGTIYRQLQTAKDFSYSAIWLVYGAFLMAVGFWKNSAFVRWQALVLVAFTICKVFLYDTSQLDKGYRILSFIGLGIVLMGISFVYQRDWLKLSARSAKAGTSA
jgi:uncharacterized membrane protein